MRSAKFPSEELPGLSVFSRTDQGVFHTYSSYAAASIF